MHTGARSSPGATQSAAGLHAPALSDLSGFLANVSHQVQLQHFTSVHCEYSTIEGHGWFTVCGSTDSGPAV